MQTMIFAVLIPTTPYQNQGLKQSHAYFHVVRSSRSSRHVQSWSIIEIAEIYVTYTESCNTQSTVAYMIGKLENNFNC